MPTRAEELREAVRLAVEGTLGVTNLVQEVHQVVGGGPAILGRPLEAVIKLLSAPTYASVRFVTQLVGAGLEAIIEQLAPVLGEGGSSAEQDFVLGALNGVIGDVLAARSSVLSIETGFRRRGVAVPPVMPPVSDRLLVLVHGSAATDGCWAREGYHHGEALEAELGFTWVALRYNSGRHVSTNGRAFAHALEALIERWPVPLRDVTVLAHSMGGLVTRSACLVAEEETLRWRRLLSAIVFLGTPHHGAPLEQGGNLLETLLGLSRYSAPLSRLAQLRSEGITDLRFGLIREEEWKGTDRFRLEQDPRVSAVLPQGVKCFALAATTSEDLGGSLRSDGLVPVDSALGRHQRPELTLPFEPDRQAIVAGIRHIELMNAPAVSATVKAWLSGARAPSLEERALGAGPGEHEAV